MPVPHWLLFVRFQHAPIRQGFRLFMFVGGGVCCIHFVPCNRFAVGWNAMRQQPKKVIQVYLAVFQPIVYAGKLPCKGRFFAQCHGRTDMTRDCQGVHQIEQGGCPFDKGLVYCFSELAEFVFPHKKTLPASSIFVKVP